MKTTFSRSLTTVAVMLLIALALVGVSFQMLTRRMVIDRTVDSLRQDAAVIAELVKAYSGESDPDAGRDFHIALTVAASVSGADAVIFDESGKLVLCASDPLGCRHTGLVVSNDYIQKTWAQGSTTDTGVITGLYDEVRHIVSLPLVGSRGERLGVVMLSTPVDKSLVVLSNMTEIFIFVSVLVVAICVVMMTVYFRRQSAPLRAMAKAASAFGHGDLNARVPTGGNHSEEVEELALAFNNMASSLQKSEYQRQQFVANVSHELKTPMTTISGYVDGILDGIIPEENSRQYLRLVSDETKRLSRLVRSMLDISRLQDQSTIPDEQKTRFDLSECAGRVLISFEQKINDKCLEVDVQMPECPVYTLANQDQITQVIYNLVDNAVKFCPEGGVLRLQIKEAGAKAYVSISNSGETIPPEELPLVFDRFHKIDKSRAKNRDSWGLGLYIVKTIIGFHDENISVTSRDGQTTLTFTLPIVN
jgi:signal transduction histidine kinase